MPNKISVICRKRVRLMSLRATSVLGVSAICWLLAEPAVACPNVTYKSKVANSDVVVKAEAFCARERAGCVLNVTRVIKAEPRALRKVLGYRVVVRTTFVGDHEGVVCTTRWQAEDGFFKGTFFLDHESGDTFTAPFYPEKLAALPVGE